MCKLIIIENGVHFRVDEVIKRKNRVRTSGLAGILVMVNIDIGSLKL